MVNWNIARLMLNINVILCRYYVDEIFFLIENSFFVIFIYLVIKACYIQDSKHVIACFKLLINSFTELCKQGTVLLLNIITSNY